MSEIRISRKKRYVIAAIVATIGVSVAFYYAEVNFPFKNSKDWNFDSYKSGEIPAEFASFQTDQNDTWIIKSIENAPSKPNVLAKLPSNDSEYHLQVLPDSPSITEGNLTVKFEIVSGEQAKSAGLLLRFIDDKHYFVLMADSLNNRLSLCKRTPDFLICSYEKNATITPNEWHTIIARLSPQGIAASMDGKLLIRANDQNYQTGQIGLWTKEDTGAYFDDIHLDY